MSRDESGTFLKIAKEDFALLRPQVVEEVAKGVAELVYDSFKQKSLTGTSRRGKLLKFVHEICSTPEPHLPLDHHKLFLSACKLRGTEDNIQTEELVKSIHRELEPNNFLNEIAGFYKKKNAKRRETSAQLETIKQMDQEKGIGLVQRNVPTYETSMKMINDLFATSECRSDEGDMRKRQVGFCYALVNMGEHETAMRVLERLSTYETLGNQELKLLEDLWLQGTACCNFINLHFTFILDKLILSFCEEILHLHTPTDVTNFFEGLKDNWKYQRLKDACVKHPLLRSKAKNLIFELYVRSYCNDNVYTFGTEYI